MEPIKTRGNFMVYGEEDERIAAFACEEDRDKFLAAPDLLAALEGVFRECAMVHKSWGDGCNRREADEAINQARAVIAKTKGE